MLRHRGVPYAFFSNYVCDMRLHLPFLLATQHIPHDAPLNDDRLRPSHWTSGELKSQLMAAQTIAAQKTTAEEQKVMRKMREQCIRAYAKRSAHSAPSGADVSALAVQFLVGNRVIENALDITRVANTPDSPRKHLLGSPQYKVLTKAMQRTRQAAYQQNIKCRFSFHDLLPRVQGLYTLPLRCPVLGWELRYAEPEIRAGRARASSTHPQDVRVWRRSVDTPLTAPNVVVMSALAVRLIEGRNISAETAARLLGAEEAAAWDRWRTNYVVGANSPRLPAELPVRRIGEV